MHDTNAIADKVLEKANVLRDLMLNDNPDDGIEYGIEVVRLALDLATAKGRLLYALDVEPNAEAYTKLMQVDGVLYIFISGIEEAVAEELRG